MPPTIPNVKVTHELPKGDLCDIYEGTHDDGTRVIVKVAGDKSNNDLVQTEGRMLQRLYPPTAVARPVTFQRYIQRCLASGVVDQRAYNVIELALDKGVKEGGPEYVSLADVIQAYPKGIDYRDMVWMFKRALVVLGWTHRKGIVHGNVTPPHFLVHPMGHGGKLIDWSYATLLKNDPKAPKPVKTKPDRPTAWARLMDDDDEAHVILEDEPPGPGHIKAITPRYALFYPPEVMAKKTPTPATDLYMLAKCVVALLGGDLVTNHLSTDVPRHIRELLAEMLVEDPTKRRGDAWETHDRVDQILEALVGKPVYRPFRLTTATHA